MKRIKTLSNGSDFRYNCCNNNRLFIKTIIIIFVLILNVSCFNAQKSVNNIKPSIGFETYSTGNGHGTFYSLYSCLQNGNNAFSVGTVIQKNSAKLSGFKVGYSRTLTGNTSYRSGNVDKDLLQINFFSSIQYTHKLPLSTATLKDEKLIWGDNKKDLDNLRLSTGEVNVGFEFYINITNQISWKNYAGASVYHNFNYPTILEHQRTAPTLNLGTGICFFLQ